LCERTHTRWNVFGEVAEWADLGVGVAGGRLQHPVVAFREQVIEVADLASGDIVCCVLRHPDGVVDLQAGLNLTEYPGDGGHGPWRAEERLLKTGATRR